MTAIKFMDGIPAPSGPGGWGKFVEMQVGQCFDGCKKDRDVFRLYASNHGWKCVTRKTGDNLYRCWRLE